MALSRLRALSLPLCASGNLATRAISEILVSKGLLRVPISSTALVHRKMSDTVMPDPPSMCHAVDGCLKLKIQYTFDDTGATDKTFYWDYDEYVILRQYGSYTFTTECYALTSPESNTYTGVFQATIGSYTVGSKSSPIPNCEFKFLQEPSLDRESNTVTIEKTPIPYAHYFNNQKVNTL